MQQLSFGQLGFAQLGFALAKDQYWVVQGPVLVLDSVYDSHWLVASSYGLHAMP